jgi:hypothetical protein
MSDDASVDLGPEAFADALDDATPAPDPTPEPVQQDPEHVPWADHKKLRDENATYRQRWQPLERTFGKLDPEMTQAFQHLAELYATDPAEAQAELRRVFGLEGPSTDDELGDPDNPPLTRADLEAYFADRDQQREQELAVARGREEIQTAAKGFGYEPGSKEYQRLLSIAYNEFMEDDLGDRRPPAEAVKLAHESITSELEAYSAAERKKWLESKEDGIGVVTTGGEPGTEKVPQTFKDAKKGLRAALGG